MTIWLGRPRGRSTRVRTSKKVWRRDGTSRTTVAVRETARRVELDTADGYYRKVGETCWRSKHREAKKAQQGGGKR